MATSRLNQEGFTILEALIAVAIMTVAFGSILAIQQSSINAIDKSRTMNVVGMLAKRAMVDSEMKIEGRSFREVSKSESGRFKPPYEDYTWEREIKEVEFPDLLSMASTGQEGAGADSVRRFGQLFTKFLKESLREVTVTIKWPRAGGFQEYSISTYWVNLNNEFPLTL